MTATALTVTAIKTAYEPPATALTSLNRLLPVKTASTSGKTFTIDGSTYGDLTGFFVAGLRFRVTGSASNDGIYTVDESAFSTDTTVTVVEAVPADSGADGTIAAGLFEPAETGVDGNSFVATGRELVLVRNVHATAAKTFSIVSVANAKNRTADITDASLDAGQLVVWNANKIDGWVSGGLIALSGEDANIEFAVLRLPT